MTKRTKMISAGAAALVIGAAGAGIAIAGGADEAEDAAEGPDVAIEGGALEKAEAAALESTGGGTVTGTEVGDEESYYEVEVTLDDGSQVDVQLDRGFEVVGSEGDEEEAGDTD